jgi:hypothetical protein
MNEHTGIVAESNTKEKSKVMQMSTFPEKYWQLYHSSFSSNFMSLE